MPNHHARQEGKHTCAAEKLKLLLPRSPPYACAACVPSLQAQEFRGWPHAGAPAVHDALRFCPSARGPPDTPPPTSAASIALIRSATVTQLLLLAALIRAVLLLELGGPINSISVPEAASGKLWNILEATGMLLCPTDRGWSCWEEGRREREEPWEIFPGNAWRISLKNGKVSKTFISGLSTPEPFFSAGPADLVVSISCCPCMLVPQWLQVCICCNCTAASYVCCERKRFISSFKNVRQLFWSTDDKGHELQVTR